jgi:hypothetical protein
MDMLSWEEASSSWALSCVSLAPLEVGASYERLQEAITWMPLRRLSVANGGSTAW